ncbi:bifunctional 5,10-methylenetetrahydrofolate dehydrogenase/5,10-methenyltetrahydrofolate cyclohydrolase [Zavarzinella formosa]|uniref:bifunctional 5,10-methylenetetrahydrofolate dehydrogenase/5,10-methenyltetrahydrofolate cyclohydrolase n=1 Tax=Zavarzinella formosa TaxID=360055 RepID=UPI00031E47DB|nr:bifunctional 5,10-methylenetetrahydrofolate dehydrogenase/5,10-methenyltetrahydrofolate cyclohydrolase [Zavarzinella formosa]
MPAQKIDGQELSKAIRAEVAAGVAAHVAAGGRPPGLAAVLVGDNPASEVYVRSKRKACEDAGMNSWLHRLPATASEEDLLKLVADLNADPAVHGILVQLPLPKQIREEAIINAISPAKDVDAFHPQNVGLLAAGHPRYLPCTPFGVQQMLARSGIPTIGKNVVVIGRSNIVGKPMALILMQKPTKDFPEAGDATVTVVHRGTKDLPAVCRTADILIAAVGVAKFVTADFVKPGAAVIDVGINSVDGKLVGDVDAESVSPVAGWLSPVPKGVGPMTITMLLQNTLKSAVAAK